MTIVIRLGGGTVMAAVPAASSEGMPIYLKLNKEGAMRLPWDTPWQKESLPGAVKSLLFHIIRYNPFLKKERDIRLAVGCPATEEWADPEKRAEMAELIRKASYAAEVRVVWEVFPAVLGALGHCGERTLSAYGGFGILCVEGSYAAIIYIRSVRECFCAGWRNDSGSYTEADFLKVCMDAGRKMEEQGITVKDLILTGCKSEAAFAEQTVRRIFTEAEIIRPADDDFLMVDGLLLDEWIEAKRGERIQNVTRSVLQYRNEGWGSSLSELQEHLEDRLSWKIKNFPENKQEDVAFLKEPNWKKTLGDEVKMHPDYRDSILYTIKSYLKLWEGNVTQKVWDASHEEPEGFVSKPILEALRIPSDFWRRKGQPSLFLEDGERKVLIEKLQEEVFALKLKGWERELNGMIGRVLDRELKEIFRKKVELMAAHSFDCILRRYDRCGRDIRPADADGTVFDRLSLQCRMGDVEAMYEMALWHRKKCTDKELQILRGYEAASVTIKNQRPDRLPYNIKNYTLWLVRAALYGHEKAGEILEQHGLYREISLIPARSMELDEKEQDPANQLHWQWVRVEGFMLRMAGFTDVPHVQYEGHLGPLQKEGYYVFSYLSDYIAADEDGFGREDSYADVYLDEFFNLLLKKEMELNPETRRRELDRMDAKRDRYWDSPLHDSRRRAKEKGGER